MISVILASMNRNILLVEDDRDICEIVEQVLAEEGYTTVAVSNGAEGLAYLRSEAPRPFVIMLDLMLPVMDAWQFRAEQMRDAHLSDIPVVIFSANPKVTKHADALGAAAVIRKPPDLDELLGILDRLAPRNAAPIPSAGGES
jgi:CheY-like chemotaxis protein